MSFLGRVVCCLLVGSPLVCGAASGGAQDSSQANTNADSLKGKLVYLRGMESGDTLSFNAQGVLIGRNKPVVFDASALMVEDVSQSTTELEIKGDRVELVFDSPSHTRTLNDLKFHRLAKKVEIRIAIDPSHPELEQTAIHKVFAMSAQEALATKSAAEETRALDSIATILDQSPIPIKPTATPVEPTTYNGAPVYKPEPGVSPPRIRHSAYPQFTTEARSQHIQGVCILDMIVDTKGVPQQIRVLRSVDPGLDRNAMIAASKYRFTPAIYQGKPVPTLIKLEINFRIP
ncbi:MAG TPA: energy transducer TonB [Silvibacterium sp.]|nr:energy transducer TonB [Silvibacterium sp.]